MHSTRSIRFLGLALLLLALPVASFAGIAVSITVAPPPLPVYVQPVCPEPGYMWTPGYWAWGDDGYYWVPGTWVPAPSEGMLWTPGYWGWSDGSYHWNAGYWGPHVGFYGGVNYGFGYGGVGFVGGEWRHGGFFYNSAVVNVNRTRVTNVYVNKTVIVNHTTVNRVSYNGGAGGIRRMPTPAEQHAIHENHFQATHEQAQHEHAASQNRQFFAKNNGGRPAVAATNRPADFSSRSAVPARAAGGRVEPASMNASSRNMPAPKPSMGRPNDTSSHNNVARPSSTPMRPSAPAPSANRGPAPRTPVANTSRPDSNFSRSQPQMHSAPQRNDMRTPATPQHENSPAHQQQSKSNEHQKH